MYVMCLQCYNQIVSYFCPFIFVYGLTEKNVNDPFRVLLRANPVTPLPYLSGTFMDK